MTGVFTKIKDNPIFKSDPDKVVRNFILPQYKRTMVEVLDDFIAVKFYSSLARDGTVKTHRHYHYTQGGKLIKILGNADEITFEGARILLKKLISNSHTNGVAAPKNTLASVFKIYCEYNAFAERTLRKLRFRFQSRLKCVSDKDTCEFMFMSFKINRAFVVIITNDIATSSQIRIISISTY